MLNRKERPMEVMKPVHPVIEKMQKQPSTEVCTAEVAEATFTPEQRLKLGAMFEGYKIVFGIDAAPVAATQGAKTLSHIALIYPDDTFEMFLEPPAEGVLKRLQRRGIDKVSVQEIDGRGYLLVAWPIPEVLKLADVWADLDAAGATCMHPYQGRMICGTIQRF
jgi:hypothetical protein